MDWTIEPSYYIVRRKIIITPEFIHSFGPIIIELDCLQQKSQFKFRCKLQGNCLRSWFLEAHWTYCKKTQLMSSSYPTKTIWFIVFSLENNYNGANLRYCHWHLYNIGNFYIIFLYRCVCFRIWAHNFGSRCCCCCFKRLIFELWCNFHYEWARAHTQSLCVHIGSLARSLAHTIKGDFEGCFHRLQSNC